MRDRFYRGRAAWNYTYALVDPRDGKVFYVGSGRGERINDHEGEAVAGKAYPRSARIREILADGLSVRKTIIGLFADRRRAREFELETIKAIGYENLTNTTPALCRSIGTQ